MSEIVLAATFSNIQEAAIAKGMLDSYGIPSFVDNEIMSTVYPIGFNALGETRLMVKASDLDRALELLEEHKDIND